MRIKARGICDGGRGVAAFVVYGSSGQPVRSGSFYLGRRQSEHRAQHTALLLALKHAEMAKYGAVTVETDSEIAVNHAGGAWKPGKSLELFVKAEQSLQRRLHAAIRLVPEKDLKDVTFELERELEKHTGPEGKVTDDIIGFLHDVGVPVINVTGAAVFCPNAIFVPMEGVESAVACDRLSMVGTVIAVKSERAGMVAMYWGDSMWRPIQHFAWWRE